MKLQFTLRWMLIAVTVLSVLFFLLLVYPTARSTRFVVGVNSDVIDPYNALDIDKDIPKQHSRTTYSSTLLPWTWTDLFACRRRISVRIDEVWDDPRLPRYATNERCTVYEVACGLSRIRKLSVRRHDVAVSTPTSEVQYRQ
jgi:hypothetical protein